MEQRILTCIGCPLGCLVTVELENGEVVSVTGNTCKRGDDYVRKEVTTPTRIVTSTVKVSGGNAPTVSVKTKSDIPKGKIFDCIGRRPCREQSVCRPYLICNHKERPVCRSLPKYCSQPPR